MSRKALIALIVIMVAAGGYYIFKRFNGNNPDGDKKENVATNKSSQKLDANKVNELLLGKWEIAEHNIIEAEDSSTLYLVKESEILDFYDYEVIKIKQKMTFSERSKFDDEKKMTSKIDSSYFKGSLRIGNNIGNEKKWILNSDGTKIEIDYEIFSICFSDNYNQLTLTKPKENITITLKRW